MPSCARGGRSARLGASMARLKGGGQLWGRMALLQVLPEGYSTAGQVQVPRDCLRDQGLLRFQPEHFEIKFCFYFGLKVIML